MAYKYALIGKYLKKKRVDAGLSQRAVGVRLGYGSAQFISNIERGEASIPPKVVRKLIPLLKISERDIMRVMMQEYETYLKSEIGNRKSN
jgi:transcriptional regulator with XRE-family HTH domain